MQVLLRSATQCLSCPSIHGVKNNKGSSVFTMHVRTCVHTTRKEVETEEVVGCVGGAQNNARTFLFLLPPVAASAAAAPALATPGLGGHYWLAA